MCGKYICYRCGKSVGYNSYKEYTDAKGKKEWLCVECYEKAMKEDVKNINQDIKLYNKLAEELDKDIEDGKLNEKTGDTNESDNANQKTN